MPGEGLSDPDEASAEGAAFGREIGQQTASKMLKVDASDALTMIGAEAIVTILAKADAFAEAGLDRAVVTAWTDAAADAFHAEMNGAATLLQAREASQSRQ